MKKKPVLIVYIVAVHLALLALAISSGFPTRAAVRLGLSTPADHPAIAYMRAAHARTDDAIQAGATIFLGDSITMGLNASAVASPAVNYGISGLRTDHLLEFMDAYRSMERAARIVLMIGTNDMLQRRGDGLKDRYRRILRKIPSGVPVTLSSIPPSTQFDPLPAVSAAREACASDSRCEFVDAHAALDSPGALLPDGVHLSHHGYELLTQALSSPTRRASPEDE